MIPTSEVQARAQERGILPPVEEVRDGVYAVPLAMPFTGLPYSFSYVIRAASGELHLIDTGLDTDENWARLTDAFRSIGSSASDVATLTLTHLHPDHAGLAGRLRRASDARVGMHIADQRAMHAGAHFVEPVSANTVIAGWDVPEGRMEEVRDAAIRPVAGSPVEVDRPLVDGDRISAGDRELRVLHTPGHTRDTS
ncbi:MBL fold metallo-hydrolase [Microbacterium sp. NIBRBAC000506063]|uniref:MBL fold metallo-hydrolase n=1 Tax=Microbacterium sp. NIBRBAC000506063 TaxID=2734618 RepID=UPI001BB5CBEB|nr:MBL fold metallo-hydrolase [Microbacterium sp. NIBRBAC000506063]QTV80471.1 MBL fold metallo-hydrolase [Microbacterium sp. NIBRBAC000506063]